MTTHRRAWMLRAGVVGALVVGAAVAFPTPALADDPDVQITNLSPGTIQPGQQATLQFTVRNNNQQPTVFAIRVDTFDGLTCQGDCNVPARQIGPGEAASLSARLVGGNVAAGQQRQGNVRVSAESAVGNDDDTDERQVTVRGQEQQPQEQSVKQVSGKVKDTTTGEGIEGASVAMLDAKGHNCSTTTTSSGNYRFTSCENQPIAVGEIFVGVQHEDYGAVEEKKVVGAAGQSVTVQFGLKSKAAATPSVTASAPATEEAAPSDEASADASGLAADNASNESSGGMGSWLLIIVGGLLVALGVGAIVLLVVRRKQDRGDPGIDDDQPLRPGGRTPVPGAAGVYHPANDATRVAGAGAGPAPTMMGRPSISDAPTMLQSPVPAADEFPDPYGAPLPPQGPSYNGQGGYGPGGAGATSVYGAASGPANGYGGPQAGGPNGAGGYGRPPAGASGEYGRPTSGYGPNGPTSGGGYGGPNGAPAGGEYGRPTSGGGYGPPPGQGGYERGGANGYGGPAAPSGYGSPAAPAGPYAGAGGARGGDDGYGRDYREPQGSGYGAPGAGAGGGYGGSDHYDEPTGRWEGNGGGQGGGYGQPQPQPPAYESGPYNGGGGAGYRPEPEPDRGGGYGPGGGGYDQGGYGPADGGYGRPASGGGGGYDQGGGYGGQQGGGGYGGNGYDQQSGHDQQSGYDPRGGYDQVPQQRGGGYDPRGGGYDDQGGYYDDQAGPRAGRGGPQQPAGRSERRSLDWLDD